MPDRLKFRGFLSDRNLYVDAGLGEDAAAWPDECSEEMKNNAHLEVMVAHPDQASLLRKNVLELSTDFFPKCIDFQGQSLLHLAALHGNISAVAALLHAQFPVHLVDR